METIKDRMSPQDMVDYLIREMTVDMSIDNWQVANCALVAVQLILDTIPDDVNYWNQVKELLTEVEKSC